MTAWIALGSNLGEPQRQLQAALAAMAMLPASTLRAVSSFYRSDAVGPGSQPDYINAVARLDTALPPPRLLRELQAIERDCGRTRNGPRWSARTLDLDILLYGRQRRDDPELVIPHPAMAQRAFVLYPLHELDPDLDIPGQGSVRQLLPAVAGQNVNRLPSCHGTDLA